MDRFRNTPRVALGYANWPFTHGHTSTLCHPDESSINREHQHPELLLMSPSVIMRHMKASTNHMCKLVNSPNRRLRARWWREDPITYDQRSFRQGFWNGEAKPEEEMPRLLLINSLDSFLIPICYLLSADLGIHLSYLYQGRLGFLKVAQDNFRPILPVKCFWM